MDPFSTLSRLRVQGNTQLETAAIVGVAPQTVSSWELNVNNSNIGNAYVPQVPDLGVSIDIFLW